MRSCIFSLFSALVALANAATLAPNLPDGFYQVHIDSNGVEVHSQLANAANTTTTLQAWSHDPRLQPLNVTSTLEHPFLSPPNPSISKRCYGDVDGGFTYCGCTWPVDSTD